jgi:hypothetical protein
MVIVRDERPEPVEKVRQSVEEGLRVNATVEAVCRFYRIAV